MQALYRGRVNRCSDQEVVGSGDVLNDAVACVVPDVTIGAWHQAHRHAVHALPRVAGDRERWDVRHEAEDFLVFAHSTGCDLERFEHFMCHFFGPRRG